MDLSLLVQVTSASSRFMDPVSKCASLPLKTSLEVISTVTFLLWQSLTSWRGMLATAGMSLLAEAVELAVRTLVPLVPLREEAWPGVAGTGAVAVAAVAALLFLSEPLGRGGVDRRPMVKVAVRSTWLIAGLMT